jgi:hypothetical protein
VSGGAEVVVDDRPQCRLVDGPRPVVDRRVTVTKQIVCSIKAGRLLSGGTARPAGLTHLGGRPMGTIESGSTIDLTTISRAVASVAVGVVHTVERAMVGDARIRTARGNAWEAICADRERAHQREEIRRMIAALGAGATTPAPAVESQPANPGQPQPAESAEQQPGKPAKRQPARSAKRQPVRSAPREAARSSAGRQPVV